MCLFNKKWMFAFLMVFFSSTHSSNLHFPDPCRAPEFCQCHLTNITCDCKGKNLQFTQSMANNKVDIIIRNCNRLSFDPNSLLNSGPFDSGPVTMALQNINNLRLIASSFAMDEFRNPHIDLTIVNTTINKLPKNLFTPANLEGRVLNSDVDPSKAKTPVLELSMINTTINVIEAKAFGNSAIESMSIVNSTLMSIQRFAIKNPLRKSLEIINTNFSSLAKRAIILEGQNTTKKLLINGNSFHKSLPLFISGTINGDVYIINNKFSTLKESPWNLIVQNEAFVRNNTFENIPKYGIHLKVKNRITLSDNTIQRLQGNAFLWIIPQERDTALFLAGNVIHTHEPMSLCLDEKFDGDFVAIKNNVFREECSCNITNDIAEGLGVGNLTVELLYEDKIHQQWLQHGKCLLSGKEVPIDLFLVNGCLNNNRLAMVLLFVFAAILITLALCVIVAWRRIKYRNFAQGTDSDYHSFSAPAPSSLGHTPWSLVQPDTRTYQETEIHVLFDKAQEIEDTEEYKPEKESHGENDTSTKEECATHSSNTSVTDSRQPANINKDKGKDDRQAQSSLVRKSCPVLP